MNWWRSKRPQEVPDPGTHGIPETESPAPKPNPILSMQRTAGNRAVQKLLPQSEGEPIAEGERRDLESSFGQDLGEVRIHRDSQAAELAAGAGANAFTTGRDIYFAAGAYGAATLAHEVTHVIQQSQAASVLPGEDAPLEHEAGAGSAAFLAGRAAEAGSGGAAPALQRQPAPGAEPPAGKLLPSDSVMLDGFDIDQSTLSGTHKYKLDEFAKRLKATLAAAPDSLVTIVGFADAPATGAHHLALGQKRADAVRDYLARKGIPEEALRALSLGEGAGVVETKGYEARNRRVEIEVVERSFWKPPALMPAAAATIAPAPTAGHPKIDLTSDPPKHEPTADAQLQDRLRRIDQAVREAEEAERSNPGISAAELAGRVLRRAARKLGLPEWVQDRAESLGRDLPGKGVQGVVNQLADERTVDTNTRNALKALIDALIRSKVK